MTLAVEKAVNLIHESGFTHIKVELEAQLFRNCTYDGSRSCEECSGNGYVRILNGAGMDTGERSECSGCHGTGNNGGRAYNFANTEQCARFLKDNISKEARQAMNYFYFYRDGSVDSELTFTLPIKKYKYIIEVIEAWNLLARRCYENNGNREMQVSGAGMHISTLTSGTYPSRRHLNERKLSNFTSEVTKLLPALYIAGTSGKFTRALKFRMPRVSHGTKYSAIYTHGGTCLEYRLFETCYQRPRAMYEYICVIARTLEYYNDPSKKVDTLGKNFPIYDGKGLEGFTCLPEQVEVIKKQFTFLKPEGMSVKKFMEERGIELSVTKMNKEKMERIKKIKLAYKEHLEAHQKLKAEPLSEYQLDAIEYFKREVPGRDEDWYWAQVTGNAPAIEDEETFISKNIVNATPSAVVAV